jgi:hypothetical protein
VSEKTFEPGKYLRNFRGRDYLEVKWRMVWLRSEHPDAAVETEMVKQSPPSARGEPGIAIFRARVAIPGAGEASGWGSETSTDFRDYIEKAETKALGRALAALGYGTQFCEDYTFNEQDGESAAGASGANGKDGRVTPEKRLASEPQIKAIYALARDVHSLDQGGADERSKERFGRAAAELTRREASQFIDELKGAKAA